jgi:hypothetical protein
MTNYDRWKLATPNYLEDEDEIHSEKLDGEGEHDLHQYIQCDPKDERQGADRGCQKG